MKNSKTQKLKEKRKKLQESHPVLDGCSNSHCKLKCGANFTEEQREKINREFWEFDSFQQKYFILHQCSRCDVKRRTLSEGLSQRNMSIKYYLHTSDGQKLQVCKKFFLTTLGYKPKNDGVVFRVLSNTERSSSTPAPDRRGRHPNKSKFDRNRIISHIESFHPEISHYRREHAPNVRYLPRDVNINFMFKDFCKKNQDIQISYELYRKIISEQNIHFTKLGNEECEQCERFRLHNPEHTKENIVAECEFCSTWEVHHCRVEAARKLYKEHAEMTFDNDTFCVSADLQKVIMLPRMDMFKAVIFTRRLTAYNESFVPVGKKQRKRQPFAVLWHEAITTRKKEDLISAFYQFFLHNRDVKNIIIWLDNCSAQNKNWCLLTFFVHIVNSKNVALENLTVNFFEPGHTFMSADSFHHQVELSLKKQKKTYDFQDFVDAVATSNSGKVDVKSMTISDFYKWKDCHSAVKINKNSPKPILHDIVQLEAKRGSFNINFKTSFNSNYENLDFIKKSSLKSIPSEPVPLREEVGIDKRKKEDLLKCLGPLIDKNRLIFYENLPVTE